MDGAAILLGVLTATLIVIILVRRARRRRAERRMREFLESYFDGDTSLEQLTQSARSSASREFLHSSRFFALAVAAFQRAVSDHLAQGRSADDERRLMGRLAALKTTFGLPDLYRTEGWRAGRE